VSGNALHAVAEASCRRVPCGSDFSREALDLRLMTRKNVAAEAAPTRAG
jgi:hypothetical protein